MRDIPPTGESITAVMGLAVLIFSLPPLSRVVECDVVFLFVLVVLRMIDFCFVQNTKKGQETLFSCRMKALYPARIAMRRGCSCDEVP